MRVDLVTHGGPGIGYGHLMRMAAMAEGLRDCGVFPRFVLPNRQGTEYLDRHEFEWEAVGEKRWCVPTGTAPDLYIIDHYAVNSEYFRPFMERAQVLYVDDLCLEPYQVSAVLNGHFYWNTLPYPEYFPSAVRLLGPQYCLLRKVYREAVLEDRHPGTGILITTGGTDPSGYMPRLVKEVLSGIGIRDIAVHVIVGAGFVESTEVEVLASQDDRVVLHHQPEHLAAIMSQCQLAVSAAGTTLYELAAFGIPALSWAMVDNQRYVYKSASENGLIVPFDPEQSGNLNSRLGEWIGDEKRIAELGCRLKTLVDGLGAQRAAEAAVQILKMR